METPDHKNPPQQEHEGWHSSGSGGVHTCHKCGWPFPNPHPSARHRRAHKRVCGTVEGYTLHLHTHDDTQHVSVSNHDTKFPSGNVLEKTISRMSTRSEDEVFTDAVTDFVDNPDLQEGSQRSVSRENSLQNVANTKPLNPELIAEDPDVDNISASNIHPENNDLASVKAIEDENNAEASLLSQDYISSSFDKLKDSAVEESKEALNEELADQRIPCGETAKEAVEVDCALRDVDGKSLDSITISGMVEPKGKQTAVFEDKVECFHYVDFPALHSVKVVEAADGNNGKVADLVEECNSRNEAHKNVDVTVPDMSVMEEKSDTLVGDLDHKGGKLDIPVTPAATLNVEDVESGKNCGIEESSSSTLADPGVNNDVCSVDDVPKSVHSIEGMLNPESGQSRSEVEQNTVEEIVQISDVTASSADTKFKHHAETVVDDNICKVPEGELAATSHMPSEHPEHDLVSQEKELTSDHDSSNIGFDEKNKVEGTTLNENEKRIAEESIEAKTDGRHMLTTVENDKNDELFELEKSHDQGEFDGRSVASDVRVGNSGKENLHASLGVQTDRDNMEEEERRTVVNMGVVGKPDDHIDPMLEKREEVGSSSPSSVVVTDRCTERAMDNVLGVTEGDRISKQHVTVSVGDAGDSSSQTDSVEGNWGSVSVLSAVSGSSPATELAASKDFQAIAEEETVSLDVKGGEVEKTSVEPLPQVAVAKLVASEIHVLQNDEQQSLACGSSTVAYLSDEHFGGKRDEVISKVHDWDGGKQHTALKTLLGEAIARSRAESPNHEETLSISQIDKIPITNNGFSSKTDYTTLDPESKAAKEEIGKEWNSPARYPVNIKTEKRQRKSRPYWMPFLCCSSVNAR